MNDRIGQGKRGATAQCGGCDAAGQDAAAVAGEATATVTGSVTGAVTLAQGMTMQRTARADGSRPAQQRKARVNGWTAEKRAAFLEVLKETSNVTEAVRTVGMTVSGVYELRRRDPAFHADWLEALEQGYSELEMLLLRHARFGTTRTETVDDDKAPGGQRTKTVHSFDLAVALRLLQLHRQSVEAYRAAQGGKPDPAAARARIDAELARMRSGRKARKAKP